MITVKLYSFTKRENSTAQPSGGTEFNCTLKEPTSIITPSIEINNSTMNYNYAYISAFNRYYFIRDITSVSNNIWVLDLECDVLATYKTAIGSSSEYVLRAAGEYNENVMESLYPMNADVDSDMVTIASPFLSLNTTQYVIGVLNSDANPKLGAVTYYSITKENLGSLMYWLLSDPTYMNISSSDMDPNIVKATFNPSQYIVECYSLPYAIKDPSSAPENISIGWWTSSVKGTPFMPWGNITDYTITSDLTITQPKHPLFSVLNMRFVRCAPWSQYTLFAGPFGNIQLDPASLAKSPEIYITVTGSAMGDCQLLIKDYNKTIIHKAVCNVKQTYCVGQINNDPIGFWSGVVGTATSAVGAALSSNPLGVIGAANAGIGTNAAALYPKMNTSGANHTMAEAYANWYLSSEFHYPVDMDPTHRGYPLCEVHTLSDLPGYILVADPDISISGTAEENDKIKSYMAGGFYYE